MRQAGGVLIADSRPGGGSTFSVFLPRVEDLPGAIEATPPLVPAVTVGGSETVLVVDDEEVVRDIAVRALPIRCTAVYQTMYEKASASSDDAAISIQLVPEIGRQFVAMSEPAVKEVYSAAPMIIDQPLMTRGE